MEPVRPSSGRDTLHVRRCLLGDRLTGLKENVILGRLIPAGTGFKGSPKEKLVNKFAPVAPEAVEKEVEKVG